MAAFVCVHLQKGELLEGDFVVLAGGAYSVPLLHTLGIHFPLQAAKGYHRDCESREGGGPLLGHACVGREHGVLHADGRVCALRRHP